MEASHLFVTVLVLWGSGLLSAVSQLLAYEAAVLLLVVLALLGAGLSAGLIMARVMQKGQGSALVAFKRQYQQCPLPTLLVEPKTGKILHVNPAAVGQLLCYADEDCNTLSQLLTPFETDITPNGWEPLATPTHDAGLWSQQQRGQTGYFRLFLYPLYLDGKLYTLAMLINKNQAVQAEKERRVLQQNLQDLIDSTNAAVWYVDRDYNILYSNKMFKHASAYLSKGRNVAPERAGGIHMPEPFRQKLLCQYEAALEGQEVSFDMAGPGPGGDFVTYQFTFSPVFGEDGRVNHIGCFAYNVTERITEQKLIEAQNDRLRRIAWFQSHEVRGPVARILGLVQLFNNTNPDDPFNEVVVQSLGVAAHELDHVVRSIVQEAQEELPDAWHAAHGQGLSPTLQTNGAPIPDPAAYTVATDQADT